MSLNRILDVKAKTGDAPFTNPADDEIYVLKARISDLRDACEQKQEILDSNKAIIAEQAERIKALESHLNQLQNGHSIPFPAITDRMMIEKAQADAERIKALEAVAELVYTYFKEVDEIFLCDDAHQIIEALQAAGYGGEG